MGMSNCEDNDPSMASMCEVKGSKYHLLVLVNGVGGTPSNWAYVKSRFKDQQPESEFLVHCCTSVRKTADGIDVLGHLLADEVLLVIKANPALRKISFVGHSLGGIVSRYAIAVLLGRTCGTEDVTTLDSIPATGGLAVETPVASSPTTRTGGGKASGVMHDASGDFYEYGMPSSEPRCPNGSEPVHPVPPSTANRSSNSSIAGLQPVNFITLASPHLGSRGRNQLPFLFSLTFLEKASPTLAPLILGRTGQQLFLADPQPHLLQRMTTDCEEGKFLSALRAFPHRVLYANVDGDQMVGWRTASIRKVAEMPKVASFVEHPHYKYIQELSLSEKGGQLQCTAHAVTPGDQDMDAGDVLQITRFPDDAEEAGEQSGGEGEPFASKERFRQGDLLSHAMPRSQSEPWKNGQVAGSIASRVPKCEETQKIMDQVDGGVDDGEKTTSYGEPPPRRVARSFAPEMGRKGYGGRWILAPKRTEGSSPAETWATKELEDQMAGALQQVPWKRVDVSFSTSKLYFMAHNLIQVKHAWLMRDGASVIQHVMDHLEK